MSIQLNRWTGNDCKFKLGTPCTKKVNGVVYCVDPCLSCDKRIKFNLEKDKNKA